MAMAPRGRRSAASLATSQIQPATLRAVEPYDPPKPPKHLGTPERELWRGILQDFKLDNAAAIAMLCTALEAHQRAREARETIDREGMSFKTSHGQTRVHPLLTVERDARSAFITSMRALGLEF
jgi:P27 family predicted phage terminase small subunit